MLILLATLAAASPTDADQRFARMTTLYDQICLRTFPDDEAIAALMKARNARELSPAEVKVTMVNDPARAWDLNDGGATLWIEFPPYHACSVRWTVPHIGDLRDYRAIADQYERASGGYEAVSPYDDDRGDIHIHAVGEQKILPDKRTESLFVFDQHVIDQKRREAGETSVSFRFVHQFAPPEEPGK